MKTSGIGKIKLLILLTVMVTVLLGYQAAPVYAAENVEFHHVKDTVADAPETDCPTVLLYDARSGQIIYEKAADVQRTPASITKIMTCMLVLENLDMDEEVTVTKEATGILGHVMELQEGEVLTVEQLVKTMMVYSANDAAVALAIAVAGDMDSFLAMMNEKAKELGAVNTRFISPNGMTESYDHTTTAKDLMLITNYALKSREFRKIVKMTKYEVPATNKHKARKYRNTNKLLYDEKTKITVNGKKRPLKYEGAFGIKTGMMLSSGYCLVAGAKRDGTELVTICLKSSSNADKFRDCITTLDFGFDNYRSAELLEPGGKAGRAKIKYGHKTHPTAVVSEGLYATIRKDASDEDLDYEVEFQDGIEAPVKKGTVVGTARVYDGDDMVGEHDVVLSEDIEKGGPWSALYISDTTAYIAIAVIILLLALRMIRKRNKRKRQRAGRRR